MDSGPQECCLFFFSFLPEMTCQPIRHTPHYSPAVVPNHSAVFYCSKCIAAWSMKTVTLSVFYALMTNSICRQNTICPHGVIASCGSHTHWFMSSAKHMVSSSQMVIVGALFFRSKCEIDFNQKTQSIFGCFTSFTFK